MSDENYEMLDCVETVAKELRTMNSKQARRDRFAAAALTGLLASHDRGAHGRLFDFEAYAGDACCAADALIAELDKPVTL